MLNMKALKKRICRCLCPKKPLREVVLIFPYNTETDELFIIQEYIHHYKKSFWKFVSGGVDKAGKDLFTHAQEELAEEVSMESDNLYHFYSFEKIFGNRGIHCYIAENPKLMKKPIDNPDLDIIEKGTWITEAMFQEMVNDHKLIWNEWAMVAQQVFNRHKK